MICSGEANQEDAEKLHAWPFSARFGAAAALGHPGLHDTSPSCTSHVRASFPFSNT